MHKPWPAALKCIGAAFLLPAVPLNTPAQGHPERPVRLIVGFGPAGSADIVARIVAQHLAPLLGHPMVVDNRPGAGHLLGEWFSAEAGIERQ